MIGIGIGIDKAKKSSGATRYKLTFAGSTQHVLIAPGVSLTGDYSIKFKASREGVATYILARSAANTSFIRLDAAKTIRIGLLSGATHTSTYVFSDATKEVEIKAVGGTYEFYEGGVLVETSGVAGDIAFSGIMIRNGVSYNGDVSYININGVDEYFRSPATDGSGTLLADSIGSLDGTIVGGATWSEI